MDFKRLLPMLCVLSLGVFFTGCGGYGRGQVIEYVKKTWNLTDFKVDSHPRKTEGDDGRTDYAWTVTEADGFRFAVIDHYYQAQFGVKHQLQDNRNYLRSKQYYQSAGCSDFTVDEKRNGIRGSIALIYKFTGRRELRRGVQRINELAAGCPPGLTLFLDTQYDHPYRTIGEYSSTAGDTHGVLKSGQTLDLAPCEANMLSVILDLRLDQAMREFTEEEIRAFVKENRNSFGVLQADGTYKVYDDLLVNSQAYGMSFPTLYEVLRRSGYAVSGTKERYSFKGADGHTYEFSNDFTENQAYYYIQDGRKVPMHAYFYNHWGFNEIKKMTGIQCADYRDMHPGQK